MDQPRRIAYFSMEIGFNPAVPTYSGGLGVLAGDTVRSAADLGVPMVAVTPVHRKGYFVQELDDAGNQTERPAGWKVEDVFDQLTPIVCVQVERRNVFIRAWRYIVKGVGGQNVPVILLDTDLQENSAEDRSLTDHLYGGDHRYRLAQEVVLGIGGVRMLRALGYHRLDRFHMNEGHAALLTLELLNELMSSRGDSAVSVNDINTVRNQCVFTTHTPVPAGHDQFEVALVDQVLGRQDALRTHASSFRENHLNLTYLALNLSHYANAVARRHGAVSRQMFPEYSVDSITNGVHAETWACDASMALYDRRIPNWRHDNFDLRHAIAIPRQEIWETHLEAKQSLIEHINQTMRADLNLDSFTLGFARRAATYKRADLLVSNPAWLKALAERFGPIQIVYAGKAHPRDGGGKDLIRRVHESMAALLPQVKVVYVPNYEMGLGRLLTSGVDVWVNTPQRPLEASGTSGMKAALNGVPSLSVLDGWWVEGCVEGVTGWAIGGDPYPSHDDGANDAHDLYMKLEQAVLPLWHHDRDGFIDVMRQSIAFNGAYFNTQRMVQEYVVKAYTA